MTHIQHAGKPQYWAARDGEELVTGVLGPTEAMLHHYSGVVVETSETAYVATLPAEELAPLPASGWLEAGALYQHNGVALMVRQSHERTHHDPADVPALFIVHREDAADVLSWVAGEQVYVGTQRTYDGRTWECLQSHVTQQDWLPTTAPTLWREIIEQPQTAEWTVGVAYKAGDQVTYQGKLYQCLQAHTSIQTWNPAVAASLWKLSA